MPGETISLKITPDADFGLKLGSLKYNDGTSDYNVSGASITMPDNAITIYGEFDYTSGSQPQHTLDRVI